MISLKYIKLFEAFDSSKVSGVISYIKNKDKFINTLKLVCNTIDFPYSKLSDDLFEYLPFKKALNKKAIDQNIGEISLIKFWFDVNGNYLEMTGVDGIKRSVYLDTNPNSYTLGKELSREDYDDIATGTIIQIDLDGDKVVGQIYYDRGSKYLIQNKREGDEPYSNDWKLIAKKSWALSRFNFENAYILIPNTKEEEEEDPYSHNVLLSAYNNGFSPSNEDVRKYINSAHFSLILDIKKLKKSEVNSTLIKKDRRDAKKGSLALKSDEVIRGENIGRYVDKISKSSSISGNLDDLKSTGKMITRILGGRNMLYFIHPKDRTESLYNLEQISSNMFDIFRTVNKEHSDEYSIDTRSKTVSYLVNSINNTISDTIKQNADSNIYINDTIRFIDKNISSEYRVFFELLNELSDTIYKHISSYKVETLDDFEIVLEEVNFIRQLLNTNRRKTFKELNRYFGRIQAFEADRNYNVFIEVIDSIDSNILKSEIETINRIIKKHIIK
jgi:hypothetical protein